MSSSKALSVGRFTKPSRTERNERLFELCKKKREKIEEKMHRRNDWRNRFVCRADLVPLWSNDSTLEKIFPLRLHSRFERFREKFTLTLSILIYIEFPLYDHELEIRELFNNILENSWHDENLPLKEGQPLHQWLQGQGENFSTDFLERQYIFLPHIIKQGGNGGIVEVDRNRPLPFDEEPSYEAGGAFGTVYKASIARNCYQNERWMSNSDRAEVVAFKKFSRERTYRSEVRNSEILRGSLTKHDCIAFHLAAIVHGDDLYIFHDYTDLGDLQILLNGGIKEIENEDGEIERHTKYDFNRRFHNPSRSHFIQQLENIAGALDILHERLPQNNQDGMYCAHMDLKPNNILVFPAEQPDLPNVGRWVLTDFGISSFKEADQAVGNFLTVGQVMEQSQDIHGTDRVASGTHRAPEMDAPSAPRKKKGTMCDIWSFGCITHEIFAFILPGFEVGADKAKKNLAHFSQQKEITNPTHNYKQDYWFEDVRLGNGRVPKLKESVRGWLEDRHLHVNIVKENTDRTLQDPHDLLWIDSLCDLIPRILEIKPEDRLKAAEIQTYLRRIRRELSQFENFSLSPSPSLTYIESSTGPLDQDRIDMPPAIRPLTNGSALTKQELQLTSEKWILNRASKCKVVDFSLSPDTSNAAWLLKTPMGIKLQVFDISSSDFKDAIFEDADLPDDVSWKQVEMANGYLLITGQRGIAKMGKMYNYAAAAEVLLPRGCLNDCVKVTVSSEGFLAWERIQNPKEILIWNGQNENYVRRNFSQGMGINNIGFSADGTYLCAWTSGSGRNFVYMIDVLSDKEIGQPIKNAIPMKRVNYRQHSCWVAQSIPACLIQEAEHHDSYFLSFDSQSTRAPRMANSIIEKDGKWVFALGNNALAMARKSWTPRWGRSKLQIFIEHFGIEAHNVIDSKGRHDFEVHEISGRTVKMSLLQEEGREAVAVCTSDFEIIRNEICVSNTGVRKPSIQELHQVTTAGEGTPAQYSSNSLYQKG